MPSDLYTLRDRHALALGDEIDPDEAGVELKGPDTWKDGSPKKLVWVHVATTGKFLGHGSGPFEMTNATFDEIVANHDRRGIAVQWDQEHASEQDATSGSIPVTGAPAQGWAHKLRRVGGDLFALTEWLDYARDGILEGRFCYCSPAVRFNASDPVTGKPCGARLSSIAITGSPFLAQLDGLRAAKDTQPVDVTIQLRDQAASILTLTAKLRDADERRASAEGLVTQLHDRATKAETEVTTLSARIAKMDAAEEDRIVQERFMTYRDDRGMAKASMLALFRANRDIFEKEYPPIDPEHRHLLSHLVPDEQRPRVPDGRSFGDLVAGIMADGTSYQDAMVIASQRV